MGKVASYSRHRRRSGWRKRPKRVRSTAGALARHSGLLALAAVTALGYHVTRETPDMTATAAIAPVMETVAIRFTLCGSGPRIDCVVDGDTIWLGGEKIRIADIDTPEVFSPECAAERERGERATLRLQALLNAGNIELRAVVGRDEDFFGRKLRTIHRDGRSLGGVLVAEGLARRWGDPGRSWCA